MEKRHRTSLIWRLLYLPAFLLLFSSITPALSADSSEENETQKEKTSRYKLYAETGFEYSDNVFLLTDSQILKMELNNQENVTSGRFKDMDSLSDIIIEPVVGFKINSDGLMNGKLRFVSSITYNYYMKNDKSSYPEGKLKLSNSIGKRGDLILEGCFVSGFFKKNYLSSVNDANHNGNIPRDERAYSSAVYDEYEGLIAYDYKIIKKHKGMRGLNVEPFLGFHNRKYNSIFNNRDQGIIFGGIGAVLETALKFDIAVTYQYEDVSSPNRYELVLYDEIASGIDANGDGAKKKNAPLITHIDRSSKRHTIEIKPSYSFREKTGIFLSYKRRTTDYISGNPLDVEHYNVDAIRQQIKTGISYKFSKACSAEAEYSRVDDDNDEDGSYAQNNFLIKIKYNIF
jgi:hypothetical protein